MLLAEKLFWGASFVIMFLFLFILLFPSKKESKFVKVGLFVGGLLVILTSIISALS